MFHRSSQSPRWELQHLAIDVLGYANLERKYLKRKVQACADKLANLGIIEATSEVFETHRRQAYAQFHRGPYFAEDKKSPRKIRLTELPIYDQWVAIGVDDEGMQYLKRNFRMDLLQQWADITLAARERHGKDFFGRSMAAYYIDNVKAAKQAGRTPPDWWHEFKKQELHGTRPIESQAERRPDQPSRHEYLRWLRSDGRGFHQETLEKLLQDVAINGQISKVRAADAQRKADAMLWAEFLSSSFLKKQTL